LVVVNCAGRTRSIMGAESLRRAGIPNKVVALRNGTMGWELAGLQCEHGRPERFVAGTPRTAALALQRATAFAAASGVREVSLAQLAEFEADKTRTLYVLDARDPSEYRAGHRRGSYNAPGGQLVQGTDNWVAVRGARIVVVDDTGVRARMSAAWLRQMGNQDVFVADNALGGETEAGCPTSPHRRRRSVPKLLQSARQARRSSTSRAASTSAPAIFSMRSGACAAGSDLWWRSWPRRGGSC
jgi:rhodanese-related sulfurtransferase